MQLKGFYTLASNLLKRAKQLGASHEQQTDSYIHTIAMHRIDPVKFSQTLPTPNDLWTLEDDTSTVCSKISDSLYDTVRKLTRKSLESYQIACLIPHCYICSRN